MKHDEYDLQCAIVEYLRKVCPNVLFCASIAGHTRMSIPQWQRAKKAGYVAGFPDIVIFYPHGIWYGMTVECKSPKGVRSPAQKIWAQELRKANFCAVTVWSMDEFLSEWKKYNNQVMK